MNKLLIASAIVIAVVLLGLPRVVGSMTEARVRERVAAIDASPSASATVKSFERGWFASTAKIDLMLVPDEFARLAAASGAAGNPFLGGAPLPIEVEFAHGPVMLQNGVQLGWSSLVARLDPEAPGITELQQTLGVPYVFEFRGHTGYGGGLAFDGDAPAFELPIDEASLQFSGATLGGTFVGRHLDADANVGTFEFTSPTGVFAVRNVAATVDNELRSEYVMPGQASLSIEHIAITDAAGGSTPTFEAANVRVTSDTALDATGERLDVAVRYALDSARVAATELTAADLGVALRNLDVEALEAYGAAMSDALGASPDAAAALATLGPEIERALRAGPSLTLDPIRFQFQNEPFEGRIEIRANADRLPPAGALDIENPFLVLGVIDAVAEARVSKPLARQMATLAAQMQLAGDPSIPPDQLAYMAEAQSGLVLTMLTGQGVLIEEGADGYRTKVELANGALTLNGNPLPFGLP